MCNVSEVESLAAPSLEILPWQEFYPVNWFETAKLWPSQPQSFASWRELFANSTMVHFYASQTDRLRVSGDPAHQAYALLAPRGGKFMSCSHCQEFRQLVDLASDWLFTLLQPIRSQLAC